jgi:hypothetical protein
MLFIGKAIEVSRGGAHQAGLDTAGGQRVQARTQLVGAIEGVAFDKPLAFERTQCA